MNRTLAILRQRLPVALFAVSVLASIPSIAQARPGWNKIALLSGKRVPSSYVRIDPDLWIEFHNGEPKRRTKKKRRVLKSKNRGFFSGIYSKLKGAVSRTQKRWASRRSARGRSPRMHPDAYTAFKRMREAALKKGIRLYVVTATRDFRAQRSIWDRKWKKHSKKKPPARVRRITQGTAMPGTSRHHWGTDMDLTFGSLKQEQQGKIPTRFSAGKWRGTKAYKWLKANAEAYGFCQPYTGSPRKRRSGLKHGYIPEPWHWSYAPAARELFRAAESELAAGTTNGLTPRKGEFSGAEHGLGLYRDLIRNVACAR